MLCKLGSKYTIPRKIGGVGVVDMPYLKGRPAAKVKSLVFLHSYFAKAIATIYGGAVSGGGL